MSAAPALPRPRGTIALVVAGWLVLAITLIHNGWDAIRRVEMLDPDDALRLVQVRDLLAGQRWYDLTQYRIDPPGGVAMHWSRLVDLPIAGFELVLRPWLGLPGAERAAAVIVPMLTLLAAMLLAGGLAARISGRAGAALATALLWSLAFTLQAQFVPLRIDHHGWQVVALLLASGGLIARNPRRGGWQAGIGIALGLSISLELLPYAALFAALFTGRWLFGRQSPAGLVGQQSPAGLVGLLDSLALASLVCFAATRLGDLSNRCDAVSPVWLAVLATAAVAVRLVVARAPGDWRLRLGLLAAAGAACGAVLLLIAPACAHGPFAALDPLVRRFWYDNVLEGRPVWLQPAAVAVQMVVPAAVGVMAAVWLARGGAPAGQRRAWAELGVLLAGMLAIAIAVSRASAVADALATVPTGAAVVPLATRIGAIPAAGRRLLAWLALAVGLLPGFVAVAAQGAGLIPRQLAVGAADTTDPGKAHKACGMPESLALIGNLPPKSVVFAPMDLGPWVLKSTGQAVVATGHHRGSAAMHDVIAGYLAAPAAAEPLVRAHHAGWVVSCGDLPESQIYSRAAPHGLMAELNAGRAPGWLEPVPLPAAAGTLHLWKVR